jgi:hypothetical protein
VLEGAMLIDDLGCPMSTLPTVNESFSSDAWRRSYVTITPSLQVLMVRELNPLGS